jgi:lysophospholipid acyltransferase (LPLAT)-like uncharacterized protein
MRLDRKEISFVLADKFLWLLILFFGRLGRISLINRKYWLQAEASGKPILIIVWHGKMLLPIFVHRRQRIAVMISEHRDGEIIAKTIHRLGYTSVRGSSTRGGSKAFRQMLRQLKSGRICGILPDGPKGPRHEAKMGTVPLAQVSGALLLPITFAARKPIVLRSWDFFTLWWPFSKLVLVYGKPFSLPRTRNPEEMEEQRRLVQDALNVLQKEADAFFRA